MCQTLMEKTVACNKQNQIRRISLIAFEMPIYSNSNNNNNPSLLYLTATYPQTVIYQSSVLT